MLEQTSGKVRRFKELVGMEINVKAASIAGALAAAKAAQVSFAHDLELYRSYEAVAEKLHGYIYHVDGHDAMANGKTSLTIETPFGVATLECNGTWGLTLKTFGACNLQMLQRAALLLTDLAKGAVGRKRRKK